MSSSRVRAGRVRVHFPNEIVSHIVSYASHLNVSVFFLNRFTYGELSKALASLWERVRRLDCVHYFSFLDALVAGGDEHWRLLFFLPLPRWEVAIDLATRHSLSSLPIHVLRTFEREWKAAYLRHAPQRPDGAFHRPHTFESLYFKLLKCAGRAADFAGFTSLLRLESARIFRLSLACRAQGASPLRHALALTCRPLPRWRGAGRWRGREPEVYRRVFLHRCLEALFFGLLSGGHERSALQVDAHLGALERGVHVLKKRGKRRWDRALTLSLKRGSLGFVTQQIRAGRMRHEVLRSPYRWTVFCILLAYHGDVALFAAYFRENAAGRDVSRELRRNVLLECVQSAAAGGSAEMMAHVVEVMREHGCLSSEGYHPFRARDAAAGRARRDRAGDVQGHAPEFPPEFGEAGEDGSEWISELETDPEPLTASGASVQPDPPRDDGPPSFRGVVLRLPLSVSAADLLCKCIYGGRGELLAFLLGAFDFRLPEWQLYSLFEYSVYLLQSKTLAKSPKYRQCATALLSHLTPRLHPRTLFYLHKHLLLYAVYALDTELFDLSCAQLLTDVDENAHDIERVIYLQIFKVCEFHNLEDNYFAIYFWEHVRDFFLHKQSDSVAKRLVGASKNVGLVLESMERACGGRGVRDLFAKRAGGVVYVGGESVREKYAAEMSDGLPLEKGKRWWRSSEKKEGYAAFATMTKEVLQYLNIE